MLRTLIFFFIIVPSGIKAQTSFEMVGSFSSKAHAAVPKQVLFTYYGMGSMVTDSARVMNNAFHITGNVMGATLMQIRLGSDTTAGKNQIHQFYFGPGTQHLVISDDLTAISLPDSEIYTESLKYANSIREQDSVIKECNALLKRQDLDISERKMVQQKRIRAIKERQEIRLKYVSDHPSSPFAIRVLRDYAGITIDPDRVEPLFQLLDSKVRSTPEGEEFSERIRIARRTNVGSLATDISMKTPEGKELKLSDFFGKYILLDFWASWCIPCRAEHPLLREVYERYRSKGFEIFAVSLDSEDAEEAWVNAIENDRVNWIQVSDLQGFESPAARAYGIRAIPQNFLIDKEGRIIGKNLRGAALETKLSGLYQLERAKN